MQTNDLTATVRGITIGQRGPTIVSVPASACLPNVEALRIAGITDPSSLDHGVQGQYLTKPGDRLVVKGRPGLDARVALAKILNGMQVTAELWRSQVGLNLTSPGVACEEAILTPTELSMMQQAAITLKESQSKITIPAPFQAVVDPLSAKTREKLAAYTRDHEMLASKNNALPFFAAHGMPVPHTVCRDRGTSIADLELQLQRTKRYVIKFDGVAGGIGVDTNSGRGYAPTAAITKVLELNAAGQLPEEFQLQEFIAGRSIGAVAIFRRDGGFRVASVHEMVQTPGGLGIKWDPETEKALRPQITALFTKLSQIDSLALLGPVGLDMQYDGKKLSIIECNPRLTGASPFGLIKLGLARHLPEFRKDLKHMIIHTSVKIPERVFGCAATLKGVFEAALGKHPGRLCLPQGLSPFDGSKLIFINDPDDRLQSDLLKELSKL